MPLSLCFFTACFQILCQFLYTRNSFGISLCATLDDRRSPFVIWTLCGFPHTTNHDVIFSGTYIICYHIAKISSLRELLSPYLRNDFTLHPKTVNSCPVVINSSNCVVLSKDPACYTFHLSVNKATGQLFTKRNLCRVSSSILFRSSSDAINSWNSLSTMVTLSFNSLHITSPNRWISGPSIWKKRRNAFIKMASLTVRSQFSWDGLVLQLPTETLLQLVVSKVFKVFSCVYCRKISCAITWVSSLKCTFCVFSEI